VMDGDSGDEGNGGVLLEWIDKFARDEKQFSVVHIQCKQN